MPETPSTNPTPTSKGSNGPGRRSAAVTGNPGNPGNPGNRTLPSWSTLAALVIALAALVVAILSWFHEPDTGVASTGHNKDEAKTSMCAVTATVREAVGLSTNAQAPGEPVAALAIAANARLALYGGGGYLLERLAAEPATPKDLKQAITAYANTLQELSINYLAGAAPDDPVQQPLREQLQTQIGELNQLCQQ
jgi:hypothetical protein